MMTWQLLAMEAPLFGGDVLYNSLVALFLLLVGAGIWFRTGNRFGWVFMIGAVVWGYLTFKELLFM